VQVGYGAFTERASQKEFVYRYVHKQEVHHDKYTFKAEYLGLLKAHEVECDPQYIYAGPMPPRWGLIGGGHR